ncbi:protein tyrosine phosphatase [Porites harrisoni]
MNSPKVPEGLEVFLAHAESLHPSGNPKRENGFAKEFQQIKALSSQLKKNPDYSCHHGEMECNRPKNRYKDIVPFDHNRVMLPTLTGVPGSDYMNGNYIKGADGNTAYIALQGPLPRTVDDFWRLIASHRCQIVIMVCREIEMGKLKCKRYWPMSKDEKMNFGGMQISLISEEDIAEGFVIRTMQMKSVKDEMTVTQLQYTAWPDHDVPKSATPLIEISRTLKSLQGNRKQQVLIHCSAGCGRTGTICAVDYAWDLLKMQKTNNFSVYDIVTNLRKQRMAMVQTKEQYELVYKAVVQLVHEQIEEEKLTFHTYVNVELPKSPKSQTLSGESNYENCEFIKSVNRWKQSDIQNGSVPRKKLPLPVEAPAGTKFDPKPSLSKKAPITPPSPDPSKRPPLPLPSPEQMLTSPDIKGGKDYVNVEFLSSNEQRRKSPMEVTENKPAMSGKPTVPHKPMQNSDGGKVRGQSPTSGQQKPPSISDYEVLPGPSSTASPPTVINTRNKGTVSDYEIPPVASQGAKNPTRHVPEGLLIDLGNNTPPLPNKHSSGDCSRYENIQVKPQFRSSSPPNVLDDMVLRGNSLLQPTGAQHDNRGFKTVPNRQKIAAGPKRCPLSAELFEDPGANVGDGFKVGHTPIDSSLLVEAGTVHSHSNVIEKPAIVPHPNTGTVPSGKGQHALLPQKPPRNPVGNYSLVGIPAAGSQMEVSVEPFEVKIVVGPPQVKNTGSPVEGKSTGPPKEPSYELVGHWGQPVKKESPPSVHAYSRNTELEVKNGTKGAPHGSPRPPPKGDREKPTTEGGISPDREGVHEVLLGTDLYATVAPRPHGHGNTKGSNSPNQSAKSTDSSSRPRNHRLQSSTSISSEDGDAPPVPQKTNEAFLAPGGKLLNALAVLPVKRIT